MIAYRCLTSSEIVSMINGNDYNRALIKGCNTFNYNKDILYKHFFMFANHAESFKKKNSKAYPCIGQYIIPDDKIVEMGFGYYSDVKTMRNDRLYNYYMPLPEIIIKMADFENSYLYKIESDLYSDFVINELNDGDNEKYNEPIIDYFRGDPKISGYLDYSYADIYYEMVYQLAKKNDMDLEKVAKILKNVDLYEEIRKFYEDNINFFYEQSRQYVKLKNKKDFHMPWKLF